MAARTAGSEERIRDLGRRQLDRRLTDLREQVTALTPPRNGWVAALRTAFGMTQAHLARRLGVSRQAVAHLELRETEGAATLRAMQEAARALGGRFVYAIVPDRPISETLEQRAYQVARELTASVRHTMRLEDQETEVGLDERTQELAKELLANPKRLWSFSDGG